MSISTGTVRGREVKYNRDGKKQVLVLQVRLSDPEDIQSVELMQSAGEDCNPAMGSKVAVVSAGSAWKIAVAVDDGVIPSMQPGEKKIYSVDSGTVQAFINMLISGNIEINGNADYAVRYNALETAFNQLQADFDTLVGVFNGHTHSYLPGPGPATPSAVPLTQGAESTADITPARVETVLLP